VILYLDTSALLKLYVEETGRAAVVAEFERAATVATVRISYAEARSALARHRREGRLDTKSLRRSVELLDGDWGTYTVVDVSEPLVRRAGALAERHGLRGYDAVQLAAAAELARAGAEVRFACFDERLQRAARREKLRVPALST